MVVLPILRTDVRGGWRVVAYGLAHLRRGVCEYDLVVACVVVSVCRSVARQPACRQSSTAARRRRGPWRSSCGLRARDAGRGHLAKSGIVCADTLQQRNCICTPVLAIIPLSNYYTVCVSVHSLQHGVDFYSVCTMQSKLGLRFWERSPRKDEGSAGSAARRAQTVPPRAEAGLEARAPRVHSSDENVSTETYDIGTKFRRT